MERETTAEFLKDLEVKPEDKFEAPLNPEEEPVKEEPKEEGFQPKNRRERRLLTENQRLREEAIASAARLQGIAEAQKLRETTEEADFLKMIEPIYGNDAPEKIEATNLLKKALKGLHEDAIRKAKEATLEDISSRESRESEEIAKEEQTLEEIEERLEEDYNLDFSNESVRKGYYSLLEKASRKDNDGNIIEYADPDFIAETFISQREKSSSRAKELASRSMVRGGQSSGSKLEMDANERFLREAGII